MLPSDALFKCHFRRLLLHHILNSIKAQIDQPPSQREPFKICKTVTVYDGVKLMTKARDLVPDSVILNAWLKKDIVPQFLREEIVKLRTDRQETVRAAIRAPAQLAPRLVQEVCRKAESAYCRGQLYVYADEGVLNEGNEIETIYGEEQGEYFIELLSRDIVELREAGVVGDVGVAELQNMMEKESALPVSEIITEGSALAQGVDVGLEQFEPFRDVADEAGGDGTDEDDSETIPTVEQAVRKPSLSRYSGALQALSEELQSVMTDPQLFRSELPCNLKALLLEELRRV